MMHHNYPLPPPETLAWIEEGRRKGTPEQMIVDELRRRGMADEAIRAALAPGATVCALAESSVEKIPFHPFFKILLYGCVLGVPAAWWMVRENSDAVRGQDRAGRTLHRFVPLYFLLLVLIGFVLRGVSTVLFPAIGFWTMVIVKMLGVHCVCTLLLVRWARRLQDPFYQDALQRDEWAPADAMIPFGVGLLGIAVEVALIAVGALLYTLL